MQLPPSKYVLITKENIFVMLPPDMTIEDCVGECEVETGRLIGAHYVLSGQVVKFGSHLHINISLHDTKTAQVKASGSVKAQRLNQLEKPLRKKTIEILGKLEPSIVRQSIGLEQGLSLKRQHLAMIPTFEYSTREEPTSTAQNEIQRPQPVEVSIDSQLSDLHALEMLERVINEEKNPNSSPQNILKQWEKIKESIQFRTLADERIHIWTGYIQKLEQQENQIKSNFNRQIKDLQRGLKRLAEIEDDDKQQEIKRKKNMSEDWQKLSRLLALSVIKASAKKSLVAVFVETYGAHEELNPYMKRPELITYLEEERREELLEENIKENTERFRRTADLSKQRALLKGRLKELKDQADKLGVKVSLTARKRSVSSTATMNSYTTITATASHSEWYCVCYLERYQGRPTQSTACRQTLEACVGLRDKIMEGTRVLITGSAGPCVQGDGAMPWQATNSSQEVWRPSKRAGAWWTPQGCFTKQP